MNALFEYRNSLDALRFTPEQKAALAERAAESPIRQWAAEAMFLKPIMPLRLLTILLPKSSVFD